MRSLNLAVSLAYRILSAGADDDAELNVSSQGERLPLPTADRFPQGFRAQYIKNMEMTWAKNPALRPSMAEMAKMLEALCNQDSSGAMVGEFM